MADKLDPQVQIHIVDLAAKWVVDTRDTMPSGAGSETLIKRRADSFDQAYKAIVKTVSAE